jgi:hypothetical protein
MDLVGDAVEVRGNTIGSNAGITGLCGITAGLQSGATNLVIDRNLINTFNGMISILGGTNVVIINNEMEMSAGFANTLGVLISMNGNTSTLVGGVIRNNSIVNNSAVANYTLIDINHSTGLLIDGNFLSAVADYNFINASVNTLNLNIGSNVWIAAGIISANAKVANAGLSTNVNMAMGFNNNIRAPLYSDSAVNIANKNSVANTVDKVLGRMVWDTSNLRIMVANGSVNTSIWVSAADPLVTVTPA